MKKILIASVFLVIVLLTTGIFSAAHGEGVWPAGCIEGNLPSNDPKYTSDQLILFCMPDHWNGQLVIYAHGYYPAQAALALPAEELTLPEGGTVPELLMSLGFAFATSSYHKNGYAVEQAGDDLNSLVSHITAAYPGITNIYVVGGSEGGLIGTMLLERFPDIYNGGLALCGPLAGGQYQIQYLGDFRVLFDYFFPRLFSFGMDDVPPYAYLQWESYYVPAIINALTNNPAAAYQLFRAAGAAADPAVPATYAETALDVLFYSIWGTNDIIEVSGGMPFGNLLTWYRGSLNDRRLNARVERVQPDIAARRYLRTYYRTTGKLSRHLVTLHNTLDGIVPFRHELLYFGKVLANGGARYLTILPVPRYGHCNFTTEELLGAFALMVFRSGGVMDVNLKSYLMPD